MASPTTVETLPNPIFEGSEKRLEVHFTDVESSTPSASGLRAIPRSTLDTLMELAACEIVSCTSNAMLDSYVLSESSLFVYPKTWILKTCGTTKLLNCLEVKPLPHHLSALLAPRFPARSEHHSTHQPPARNPAASARPQPPKLCCSHMHST